MEEEVLIDKGNLLVRRMRLQPGERMAWHIVPYERVSVVLQGERLQIDFRDGGEPVEIAVAPGQVDWDLPTDRVHRGVNVGRGTYKRLQSSFSTSPTPRRSQKSISRPFEFRFAYSNSVRRTTKAA